jgi:hypothetical protein
MLSGSARGDLSINGMPRYADVEALAFAIVHALEDRDSGLIAEVDALRRQVSALATMTDRAMNPTVDVSALEAMIAQQPELRHELNGVVEHLLDSARSGRPAAPTTTALLLLMLPLTQSIGRRHDQLEGEVRALRQEISMLCEEVSNLGHVAIQERARQSDASTHPAAIQDALRVELAPLRQEIESLDRTDELAALRAQIAELGERLTSAQPVGASASLQDAIRADLAKLIERLNAQSRAEQVVALREEVRAQLGALNDADELASQRMLLTTELAQHQHVPDGAGHARREGRPP